MSTNGEISSVFGLDSNDHQVPFSVATIATCLICLKPTFIFTPSTATDAPERPTKRRRVARTSKPDRNDTALNIKFEPLLNGLENIECVRLRQDLFNHSWTGTAQTIQVCGRVLLHTVL